MDHSPASSSRQYRTKVVCIVGTVLSKNRKKALALMAVQFVLSQLAIYCDASGLVDFFGVYFLSSIGSLLFGPILIYKDSKSCALKGAFYLTTYVSIAMLAFIVYGVFKQGPLGPSGLIFAGMFLINFVLALVGAMVGHVYCRYLENRKYVL